MKRLSCLGLALALSLSLLAGCGGGETATSTPDDTTPSTSTPATTPDDAEETVSGTVNTDGSTSMADVMAAFQESFSGLYPDVTVNYSGTGSGSGITNALAGTVDIGLSSRALTDEEKAEGATVTSLTVEQIAQIYTGEITNWSELGGADAPIAVIGRDAASGTRGAFEEIVGVEDACKYTNEYESTGEVIGSVAGNPNAIGYASLSAVDESVTAVEVNGVAPSEATVADGTYEIQRPFVMVTKEGVELSPAAQAFLDWAMSADAADEVEAAGCVSPNA